MGTLSNEPVVTAASIASLISAFVIFLRAMGWLPLTDDQFNALMAFVVLAIPVGFAFWARARVTPVANPKDNEGNVLVPQTAAPKPALPSQSLPG